jgi:hypothetical protein
MNTLVSGCAALTVAVALGGCASKSDRMPPASSAPRAETATAAPPPAQTSPKTPMPGDPYLSPLMQRYHDDMSLTRTAAAGLTTKGHEALYPGGKPGAAADVDAAEKLYAESGKWVTDFMERWETLRAKAPGVALPIEDVNIENMRGMVNVAQARTDMEKFRNYNEQIVKHAGDGLAVIEADLKQQPRSYLAQFKPRFQARLAEAHARLYLIYDGRDLAKAEEHLNQAYKAAVDPAVKAAVDRMIEQ